ncbi:MAG: polyketide synthase, partial [Planctomycetota bacterium]
MTDSTFRWTPLAIVGASCRLPGARNVDEFWELVRSGQDATGELPEEILDRELYYDPQPVKRGKSYSAVGGLIPRLPFNNGKCHLPEDEIANYDESHLTMCEVASEALSDANYDPFDVPHRNAGVYFGHTGGTGVAGELMYAIGIEQTAQYLHELESLRDLPKNQRHEIIEEIIEGTRRDYDFRRDRPKLAIAPVTGCELIARAFGLDGPCVVVDAACASSLQALAIAARALAHKSIDMAIVGGASCCKGDSLILFSAAQSVTAGKSCPFDTAASGLVTAEGYVTFILKRLEDAVAAGDRVRGVIRGLGMSSDGKGKSLWAPLKTDRGCKPIAVHALGCCG